MLLNGDLIGNLGDDDDDEDEDDDDGGDDGDVEEDDDDDCDDGEDGTLMSTNALSSSIDVAVRLVPLLIAN